MWDVDDSGSINVTEMTNIIATMDDVEGVEQDPKVTHKSSATNSKLDLQSIGSSTALTRGLPGI